MNLDKELDEFVEDGEVVFITDAQWGKNVKRALKVLFQWKKSRTGSSIITASAEAEYMAFIIDFKGFEFAAHEQQGPADSKEARPRLL